MNGISPFSFKNISSICWWITEKISGYQIEVDDQILSVKFPGIT